jgi:hypothetical protein
MIIFLLFGFSGDKKLRSNNRVAPLPPIDFFSNRKPEVSY